jgi:ketosteroid isomerase-like protein
MKLRVLSALVFILIPILILAMPVVAQEPDAESKIIALEKAWNQAYKLRDRSALAQILHDSMIVINDDGSLQSRSMFLAGIDAMRASSEQQAEPESISVHVFGDVAIATGVFRTRGVENGKTFARRNRFVDTWVSKDGTWVCIAASATPVLR